MRLRYAAPASERAEGAAGRSAGFTLIEVLGALVIFAAGVLMAAELANTLSVQVRTSGLRAGVVAAAQEKMEEVERLPYDSLSVGTTTETLSVQGETYERITTVTEYAPRTLSVEVVVEPADGDGPSHSLLSYAYEPW